MAIGITLTLAGAAAVAEEDQSCAGLPGHNHLRTALEGARAQINGGFGLDMWGTEANTANAFSLPGLALSTADLYAAVQPGGTLYGLQHSNPVDTSVAYHGPASDFGEEDDPMIGHRIGGVNVFGGGLALYNSKGVLLGAIGVSGDTSCADHNIAWRTRHTLNLDFVPNGVSPKSDDNINYQTPVPVQKVAH